MGVNCQLVASEGTSDASAQPSIAIIDVLAADADREVCREADLELPVGLKELLRSSACRWIADLYGQAEPDVCIFSSKGYDGFDWTRWHAPPADSSSAPHELRHHLSVGTVAWSIVCLQPSAGETLGAVCVDPRHLTAQVKRLKLDEALLKSRGYDQTVDNDGQLRLWNEADSPTEQQRKASKDSETTKEQQSQAEDCDLMPQASFGMSKETPLARPNGSDSNDVQVATGPNDMMIKAASLARHVPSTLAEMSAFCHDDVVVSALSSETQKRGQASARALHSAAGAVSAKQQHLHQLEVSSLVPEVPHQPERHPFHEEAAPAQKDDPRRAASSATAEWQNDEVDDLLRCVQERRLSWGPVANAAWRALGAQGVHGATGLAIIAELGRAADAHDIDRLDQMLDRCTSDRVVWNALWTAARNMETPAEQQTAVLVKSDLDISELEQELADNLQLLDCFRAVLQKHRNTVLPKKAGRMSREECIVRQFLREADEIERHQI